MIKKIVNNVNCFEKSIIINFQSIKSAKRKAILEIKIPTIIEFTILDAKSEENGFEKKEIKKGNTGKNACSNFL